MIAQPGPSQPVYLHHLRPHVEGVQPVGEARVAVQLCSSLSRSHAQLALPLLANITDQLRLWGVQKRLFIWAMCTW